jgi:hypothetical protein
LGNQGGHRPGAGRKKGSMNKTTIARQSVAEVLDVNNGETLEAAIHRRGHSLLLEMERIAHDPTQPVGARIVAARTALPFLISRRVAPPPHPEGGITSDEIVRRLQYARTKLHEWHKEREAAERRADGEQGMMG